MEIPFFSLAIIFIVGYILTYRNNNFKLASTEDKIILIIGLGFSGCLLFVIFFMAIIRLF